MKNLTVILALIVAVVTSFGCAMKAATTGETAVTPETGATAASQEDLARAAALNASRGIQEESVPDRPATPRTVAPADGPTPTTVAGRGGLRTVYFEYNQHLLAGEAPEILAENAAILKGQAGLRIVLQGHCDERGSDQYNIALGERRAEAVRDYLISLGVAAERLETVSFGEERPADPGQSEEAWARNRRVEFVAGP